VLGSRILGGGALRGGMPRYKYVANRFLTGTENLLLAENLSEYHTGFRGYSRKVIETLPLLENSDDFVFDNQFLVQAIYFRFKIGEISCPSYYFEDASSVDFWDSVKYGFGVLSTAAKCVLQRVGLADFRFLNPEGRRIGGHVDNARESMLVPDQPAERLP
jgi:hypothetical protein